MLTLPGAQALSDFRIEKRLSLLQQQIPHLTGLSARFVHLAKCSQPLCAEQQEVLEKLLEYGPKSEVKEADGLTLFVVPRPGTISPWSSKATDIAHNRSGERRVGEECC